MIEKFRIRDASYSNPSLRFFALAAARSADSAATLLLLLLLRLRGWNATCEAGRKPSAIESRAVKHMIRLYMYMYTRIPSTSIECWYLYIYTEELQKKLQFKLL